MKMKDVRPYSVWTHGWSKRYLLKHPWIWVKDFCSNLRAAYYRSKYGFAPRDVWELGYWFLDIFSQMLKYLAENGVGYKVLDEKNFDEDIAAEDWKNHLLSISNLLENARDEVRDKKNEYYPAWEEQTLNDQFEEWYDEKGNRHLKAKDNTIVKKYLERDAQLAREQDTMIEEALELINKVGIKSLWD